MEKMTFILSLCPCGFIILFLMILDTRVHSTFLQFPSYHIFKRFSLSVIVLAIVAVPFMGVFLPEKK